MVGIVAIEIPPAIRRGLPVPCTAIISNTEIIPVTVPNNPINGQMAMVVFSSSIRADNLLDASEIHASRILCAYQEDVSSLAFHLAMICSRSRGNTPSRYQ